MYELTRRSMLKGLGALGACPLFGGLHTPEVTTVTIDFGNPIGKTDPLNLGYGVTTYVRTAVDSQALAEAERRLDARYVRIPVRLKQGRVTTGATGAPETLDAGALIRWYQQRSVRVLAVPAGATNDVDVQTGDVGALVRALSGLSVDLDALEISTPNEPNNQKLTLEESIALAIKCSDEVRRVRPSKRLWGPAWTWYDRNALRKFADAMGERLAGVDFHHYAMGVNSLSTADAMAQTPTWGREVSEVRQDLKERGLPDRVSVSELNFSWRFEDGTPPDGKNQRFFTGVNTVWCASTLGHILLQGGCAAVYGNQNGALGIFTEDAMATPMPAHWGLAAWTGAGLFPHFADTFYEAGVPGTTAALEAFAVSNVAGGKNVVLINKSETADVVVDLKVEGFPTNNRGIWRSNPDQPCSRFLEPWMPRLDHLSLPRMTVTVIVLS